MDEAEAVWLMTASSSGKKVTVPGLYGGTLSSKGEFVTLDRYSLAPGVTLSGGLVLDRYGPPLRFEGAVFVNGPAAAQGVLRLSRTRLYGTLDRKKVSRLLAAH
ncbi:MAG: hypothetical protein ABI990_11640 [Actinomycetota bacterium]